MTSTGMKEVVRQEKQKIYRLVRNILLQLREVDVKVSRCLWDL